MPTRHYAKEFYECPPEGDACPVCGLSYVKDSPTDRKIHRLYHREVVDTFEPRSNPALARRHALHGVFVPVTPLSPRWMHKRLYRIALMLKRENGYDFSMWDQYRDDDGIGYILTDEQGRALGGCAVRWREWTDRSPGWFLQWIWVAPPCRRQGLLRRTWEMLKGEYGGIFPEPPLSPAAAQFFRGCEDLPDIIKQWVEHILANKRERVAP